MTNGISFVEIPQRYEINVSLTSDPDEVAGTLTDTISEEKVNYTFNWKSNSLYRDDVGKDFDTNNSRSFESPPENIIPYINLFGTNSSELKVVLKLYSTSLERHVASTEIVAVDWSVYFPIEDLSSDFSEIYNQTSGVSFTRSYSVSPQQINETDIHRLNENERVFEEFKDASSLLKSFVSYDYNAFFFEIANVINSKNDGEGYPSNGTTNPKAFYYRLMLDNSSSTQLSEAVFPSNTQVYQIWEDAKLLILSQKGVWFTNYYLYSYDETTIKYLRRIDAPFGLFDGRINSYITAHSSSLDETTDHSKTLFFRFYNYLSDTENIFYFVEREIMKLFSEEVRKVSELRLHFVLSTLFVISVLRARKVISRSNRKNLSNIS